jgi:predicted nuclease of predicted toxin-antitoxin system
MSQFLANENVPRPVVVAVRNAGVDVAWVAELQPGADDDAVLALAVSENRVLLTFDKDFGEMVFRKGGNACCGILLFRTRLRSPEHLSGFVVRVLSQPIQWNGSFSVAEPGRIRSVPLPPGVK